MSAAEREALAGRVLELVERGPDGPREPFEPLALELFAFQYRENAPFRAWCDARGASPATVRSWRDVPGFPTGAFKSELVASFPAEQAVMAQLTSGTTEANARGRIYRDELGRRLVFAANRVMTGAFLFPDLEPERRCRLLLLTPSPQLAPSMGMAIGMEQTRVHFGTPDSRFLIGRSGLDVGGLLDALAEAERTGVPVALVGATSAYVVFLRACERRRLRFALPVGSRVCDGGGYRGRFGEMTRDEYHGLVGEVLGVPADHCVNVLGMAESATNYFDAVLRERTVSGAAGPRRKIPPPWTRVEAVDVKDLSPLPAGRPGLLRHHDLANLPTVACVQSDNLGIVNEDGSFEILGRARVKGGEVSLLPSERAVGPMGDNRVFRLLDAYVSFSIGFKMGLLGGGGRTGGR
jgi:hypothetical protein